TSLKVGGAADLFVAVGQADDAAMAQRWAALRRLPLRWIGGGSNLLVADHGLDGLAARFVGRETSLPTAGSGEVVAAAGRSLSNLARSLARLGWTGLEWAATVPGTVGGAVANNAGAFGSRTAEGL